MFFKKSKWTSVLGSLICVLDISSFLDHVYLAGFKWRNVTNKMGPGDLVNFGLTQNEIQFGQMGQIIWTMFLSEFFMGSREGSNILF